MKTLLVKCCVGLALLSTACLPKTADFPAMGPMPEMTSGTVPEGSFVLAPLITYDVTVKNPDPADHWTDECLKQLDLKRLVNEIFDAVYSGRLTAYHYHEERPMSIAEIRKLEKDREFDRSRIARLQFVEEWYLNEESLRFHKQIRSLMLAYELYDQDGNIRGYKSAFQVFLNH